MKSIKVQSFQLDGNCLSIPISKKVKQELEQKHLTPSLLYLNDQNAITELQRRKAYALIGEVAAWSGYDKTYLKDMLKDDFCFRNELPPISLMDVDRTTASEFISYLVDFCVYHNVPMRRKMTEYCDDIERYLYACLLYKQCAVCGRRGEQKTLHFHHCGASRTGSKGKSTDIPLVGLQGMALCWEHHHEIHCDAEQVFFDRYHVHPIVVDQRIAAQYKHYRQASADEL